MLHVWMKRSILSFGAYFILLLLLANKPIQAQQYGWNIGAGTLTVGVDGQQSANTLGGSPAPVTAVPVPVGTPQLVMINAIGVEGGSYDQSGTYHKNNATVDCEAHIYGSPYTTTLFSGTITDSMYTYISWTPDIVGTYTVQCTAIYDLSTTVGSGYIQTGEIYVPVT